MSLRPYKFIVQAIVQQVDEDGNVVGELPVGAPNGDPVVLFGCDQLAEWAEAFPDKLGDAEQAAIAAH
jgi:hypothetical protein